MIHVEMEGKNIKARLEGGKFEILEEFTMAYRGILQTLRDDHDEKGIEFLKKTIRAAELTDEEIEKEIKRLEKEIFDEMIGTEEEKRRAMDAMERWID